MTEPQINLFTWHSNRELSYTPAHFVVVNTVLTQETKQWILEKQQGRFSLVECPHYGFDPLIGGNGVNHDWHFGYYPAFEDPAEAIHFKLVWQ